MKDNLRCQGSQLASVFGVVHILAFYRDQTDQQSLYMFWSVTMDCECRAISDVKVVSLHLYLVLFTFLALYRDQTDQLSLCMFWLVTMDC